MIQTCIFVYFLEILGIYYIDASLTVLNFYLETE